MRLTHIDVRLVDGMAGAAGGPQGRVARDEWVKPASAREKPWARALGNRQAAASADMMPFLDAPCFVVQHKRDPAMGDRTASSTPGLAFGWAARGLEWLRC